MKFGYCVNMLSLPGSDQSGREFIPMIGALGFDYVELPVAQLMAYDDEAFERLVIRPLRASGLTCRCCNNLFPGTLRLTGPKAAPEAALAYADRAMSRVRRLGAQKVVFGSAGARNYPAGFPRERAVQQLREMILRLEPLAARHGVTLAMEHLNRMESNLLNTPGESASMVGELNLPHVGCLLDSYHMLLGGGSFQEIRETGDRLLHVHLARVLGRGLPCPGDEVDWSSFWAALRGAGYDGDCSIEAYAPVENRERCLGDSLTFLRQSCKLETESQVHMNHI